jgi:predicted nucleic acid-binding protein
VKLILNEAGSEEAAVTVANALKKGYALHTVDLALAECLNVIWKHISIIKDLKAEEANGAVEDLTKLYDGLKVIVGREIAAEAMHVVLAQNISAYDALYIAAAQKINGTLYTADQKLYALASRSGNTKLLKSEP